MTTTQKRYRAFGRVLESAVPLGELHEVAAGDESVGWRLLLADGSPPACPHAIPIGQEDIAYGATVSLALLGEGAYRLTYSDTGVFDLSAPEGVIRWWRPAGCDMDLAAMDILGRVVATILHAEGTVTLHASAVAVDGVAIGFLAPKFHGKSTLAAAMTYVGAQLVSDDALAILPGTSIRCFPGVPSMRLREEAAAHFPRTRGLEVPEDIGRWRVIDMLPSDQVALQPLPLDALYVLSPRLPGEVTLPVQRTALSSLDGLLALTRFAKMGTLLGDREGQRHISRVIDVVASVPVYTLELVRDLDQLAEVTRTIAAWHRRPQESAT
ncbi:MAG: hypothetical protein IPF47_06190 [Gemmatimonadetes bacterium]|nr:hypothetical protein [Gemmatimonadota bacterium]